MTGAGAAREAASAECDRPKVDRTASTARWSSSAAFCARSSTMLLPSRRDGVPGASLADLGVHLLELGAEVGSIGPAGDDLLDPDAVLAVAGECGGGLIVGGSDAPLRFQGVVELLTEVGEAAADAHLGQHHRHAPGFGTGRLADAVHHG